MPAPPPPPPEFLITREWVPVSEEEWSNLQNNWDPGRMARVYPQATVEEVATDSESASALRYQQNVQQSLVRYRRQPATAPSGTYRERSQSTTRSTPHGSLSALPQSPLAPSEAYSATWQPARMPSSQRTTNATPTPSDRRRRSSASPRPTEQHSIRISSPASASTDTSRNEWPQRRRHGPARQNRSQSLRLRSDAEYTYRSSRSPSLDFVASTPVARSERQQQRRRHGTHATGDDRNHRRTRRSDRYSSRQSQQYWSTSGDFRSRTLSHPPPRAGFSRHDVGRDQYLHSSRPDSRRHHHARRDSRLSHRNEVMHLFETIDQAFQAQEVRQRRHRHVHRPNRYENLVEALMNIKI